MCPPPLLPIHTRAAHLPLQDKVFAVPGSQPEGSSPEPEVVVQTSAALIGALPSVVDTIPTLRHALQALNADDSTTVAPTVEKGWMEKLTSWM